MFQSTVPKYVHFTLLLLHFTIFSKISYIFFIQVFILCAFYTSRLDQHKLSIAICVECQPSQKAWRHVDHVLMEAERDSSFPSKFSSSGKMLVLLISSLPTQPHESRKTRFFQRLLELERWLVINHTGYYSIVARTHTRSGGIQ